MSNSPIDAVLAGTKPFAVALLAPLTTRVGVRPRIAADATQALALSAPGGLVVIELSGPEALPGIERLAKAGGRRVVAGVAATHSAAEPALRALGVEIARWDGRPEAVLDAVARQLGVAAPAAPAPTPARVAPAAPAPQPVAKPPPAARPAGSPAAVQAAAKPAAAPVPQAAPRPAAPAKAAAPAAPAKPVAPAVAVAKPAATPAPIVPPPAPTAAAAPSRPAATFFADLPPEELDTSSLDVDVSDAFDLLAPTAALSAAPPQPAGDWPATVLDEATAAEALVLAMAGRAQGPWASVAVQVVDALSELERAVLSGAAQPFDAGAIRRAAATRLRVAQALASAPPPGAPIDQGAVHTLLGEIDGLLSAVATLASSIPPELQSSVEAVRNGLVAEAIDFSEAVQKIGTRAPAAEARAAPARKAAPAAGVAATRVLDVRTDEEGSGGRSTIQWIVLAIALLLGGGYHLYGYLNPPHVPPPPTMPGAPEGLAYVDKGDVKMLVKLPGRKVDLKQLDEFRQRQSARGIEVRESGSDSWILVPAGSAKGAP